MSISIPCLTILDERAFGGRNSKEEGEVRKSST